MSATHTQQQDRGESDASTSDQGSDLLVVAVHDVNHVWDQVKQVFLQHERLARISFNLLNGQRRAIRDFQIRYLPVADSLLQKIAKHSRSSANWFRNPYAKVLLVACDNPAEYKKETKQVLRELIEKDRDPDRSLVSATETTANQHLCYTSPWIIVHIVQSDSSSGSKKVLSMMRDDFGNKKAERCFQLCLADVHRLQNNTNTWLHIKTSIVDSIKATFEARLSAYSAEVRKLSLLRQTPGWSFPYFFLVKGSLARMYEMGWMHDEAVREYYELEVIYLENIARASDYANGGVEDAEPFGGMEKGDEVAGLFDPYRKNLRRNCIDKLALAEFDVRQYLFAKRALAMLQMSQVAEVAEYGQSFISSFTRSLGAHKQDLPPYMCDAWVFSACQQLEQALQEKLTPGNGNGNGNGKAKDMGRVLEVTMADLCICSHSKLANLGEFFKVYEKDSAKVLSKAFGPMSPLIQKSHFAGSLHANDQNEQEKSFEEEIIYMENVAAVAAAVEEAKAAEQALISRKNSTEAGTTEGDPVKSSEHNLSRISNDTLRKALSSSEAFSDYLLMLTRKAADYCKRCGRYRNAMQLEAHSADILISKGEVKMACELLSSQCQLYFEERWYDLLVSTLQELVECQNQIEDSYGLFASLVKVLVMEDEIETGIDSEQLQMSLQQLSRKPCADKGSKEDPVLNLGGALDLAPCPLAMRFETLSLKVCQNDIAVMHLELHSTFPFALECDHLSLEIQRIDLLETDTSTSASICVMSSSAKDKISEFLDDLQTCEYKQVFKKLEAHNRISPGKNYVFCAIETKKIGLYMPLKFGGEIYRTKVSVPFTAYCQKSLSVKPWDSASIEVFSTMQVLEEKERLAVSSVGFSQGGWFMLNSQPVCISIAPKHDRLGDCQVSLALSCNGRRFETSSAQICVPCAREAQYDYGGIGTHFSGGSLCSVPFVGRMKPSAEGAFQMPQDASSSTSYLWMNLRLEDLGGAFGNANVNHVAVKSDNRAYEIMMPVRNLAVDYKISYLAGCKRVVEGSMSVALQSPFSVSILPKQLNESQTMLQITLKSELPWKVVICDASLGMQEDLVVMNDLSKGHGLLPAGLGPGNDFNFVYILEHAQSCSIDEEALVSVLNVEFKADEEPPASWFHLGGDNECLNSHALSPKAHHEGWHDPQKFSLKFCMTSTEHLFAAKLMLPPSIQQDQCVSFVWHVQRLSRTKSELQDEPLEVPYEIDASASHWIMIGKRKGTLVLCDDCQSEYIKVECIALLAGSASVPKLAFGGKYRDHALFLPTSSKILVHPPSLLEVELLHSDLQMPLSRKFMLA